ncbi:glycosyltransferase family 4 protein [Kitasatospora sp. RB6PN24]|uniref:glycosyltransferase family 4 protein n=1 Tax=Kitasatospora humi TaxID=2893891 RepID=UPI001E397ED6|nr:glycosyltransferase family 4 protein [Kitasatospora humi]MCC9308198.1 glycosyltransferase family 4 protein [Kitasatospora humi]
MRILQLTDFYRPTIGGLERHVESLSTEFVRHGHEVTVLTLRIGDRPVHEVIDGVRVERVPSWSGRLSSLYADASRPFHPTVPDPGALAALRAAVSRLKPDIVHSHSWLQYSYFPLHRRAAGAPGHVVTLHDYGLSCAKKTNQQDTGPCSGPAPVKCVRCARAGYGAVKGTALAVGLRASRALHGRADAYIAISTAVAAASQAALLPETDLRIIPSMVPRGIAELARTTPRPDFLPAGDGYLLFVGALGPHKGVNVLLDAYRMLRHKVPLVLIGTPRADTPVIDDPAVTVVRDVPSAQVMAAWRGASVAVVPSVWEEPLGQVAVEAMLAGRPVVASDVGGLRDVVEDGVTGLRVPPADPRALAAAIDRLLGDPRLRERFGERGRERASAFTVERVAPRVLDLFTEVLARRRTHQTPLPRKASQR